MALFVIVAGIVLGRTRLTPLRPHHFVLLGLGLTQTSPLASLAVVACLLALGWRARTGNARPALYNVGQIALVLLVAGSLLFCADVIATGLRWFPESFILGEHAAGQPLSWFQDRSGPALAQPSVLSLPIWVYRACVMAWALWLLLSLIRWSPWVWSCLRRQGLWHRAPRPIAPPPTAV